MADQIGTLDPEDRAEHYASETTAERLNFLIEEEKLAHDVYIKMNEVWGSQVFGNILKSEATRQRT